MSEVVSISNMFSDWYALKCLIQNIISCMYCFVAYNVQNSLILSYTILVYKN
jgi:hypothetical protein